MQILYSGAKTFLGPSNADQSLGGLVSNTVIENAQIGNLFGDITNYTLYGSNPNLYKAVIIHNDSTIQANNIQVFLQYPTSDDESDSEDNPMPLQAQYLLAIQPLQADACGDLSTKSQISDPSSKPFGVSFVNADGIINALTIPSLAEDDLYCIWIQRIIKASAKTPLTDDQLLQILNGTLVLPKQEDISLTINWTE